MSQITYRFQAAAASDVGRQREQNEDRIHIDPEGNLFIVADGMGGAAAGEVASRLVVETFTATLEQLVTQADAPPPPEALETAVLAAHERVRERSTRDLDRRGMGATLVAAWYREKALWSVHVGDSRLYRLRAGTLARLTEDHTVLNEARRHGALPADPAEWPSPSLLSQTVGSSRWLAPAVARHSLQEGDRFLLCSDGLTAVVPDRLLAAYLGRADPAAAICRALVAAANERGGPDNISVIVIQVLAQE